MELFAIDYFTFKSKKVFGDDYGDSPLDIVPEVATSTSVQVLVLNFYCYQCNDFICLRKDKKQLRKLVEHLNTEKCFNTPIRSKCKPCNLTYSTKSNLTMPIKKHGP
jgi:hypothetical protein